MSRLDWPEMRNGSQIAPAEESPKTSPTFAIILVLVLTAACWFLGVNYGHLPHLGQEGSRPNQNAGAGITGVGDYGSRP